MILNYKERPFLIKKYPILMYIYSIPIFGVIVVIISDFLESIYLIYFYTKHFKKDKYELNNLENKCINKNKLKYRMIIENIYETIPQVFFQLYIFKLNELDILPVEIYLSISIGLLNLFYKIILLYFESKYYGTDYFTFLLFFMTGEQRQLIKIGFGLDSHIQKHKNVFLKTRKVSHNINYYRPKLNYDSIQSINEHINKTNLYTNIIKTKNLESKTFIFEISQDLNIKLPMKYSSNVFNIDILNMMMNIRDKRYNYNYNQELIVDIVKTFDVETEFYYLLTYNTNKYENIKFNKKTFISYDNYVKFFLKLYLLPTYFKYKLDYVSTENYSDSSKENYIDIFKKNFKIKECMEELHNKFSDYDIIELNKKTTELEDKHNKSLFLLSVVCYHCPITIFSEIIDFLGKDLRAYGISENHANIYNLQTELNKNYHKKKILESINKNIINCIEKFEKYRYFEEIHIFNKIYLKKKGIFNYYDKDIHGNFELGIFEVKTRSNSVVTKRMSLQDNNKYNSYETIEIDNFC